MSRMSLMAEMIIRAFPERFRLARVTRLPAAGRIADRVLFGRTDIVYLPMDRVIRVDKAIDPGEQMLLPSQAVEYFIERYDHRWIMNWCICRKASGCKDYPPELGCIFLGRGAAKIDPSMGRPVTKEEALAHLKKCSDAGLVHMIGRNRLDELWLGTGRGDDLVTICNCCPCCCLWKILPSMAPAIGAKVRKLPGLELIVTQKCTGCGACAKACFMNAISVSGGKAVVGDQCRGCGRCAARCPRGAIVVRLGNMEKAIRGIAAAVDVT